MVDSYLFTAFKTEFYGRRHRRALMTVKENQQDIHGPLRSACQQRQRKHYTTFLLPWIDQVTQRSNPLVHLESLWCETYFNSNTCRNCTHFWYITVWNMALNRTFQCHLRSDVMTHFDIISHDHLTVSKTNIRPNSPPFSPSDTRLQNDLHVDVTRLQEGKHSDAVGIFICNFLLVYKK